MNSFTNGKKCPFGLCFNLALWLSKIAKTRRLYLFLNSSSSVTSWNIISEIEGGKSQKAIYINIISLDSYSHKLHTPWLWNRYDEVPLWSSYMLPDPSLCSGWHKGKNIKEVTKPSFKKSDASKLLIIKANSWLFGLIIWFSKNQVDEMTDF